MTKKIKPDDVLGIECKHISYQDARDGSLNDYMLVKEIIHTKDGGQYPRLKAYENYKRPVYITRENYRNHKDKKECEEIDKLQRYEWTQVEMAMRIQQALGARIPNPKLKLRDVCSSPYVYNADLNVATLLRAKYRQKWPNLVSRNKVAVLDTERDVTFGTDETILITVTCGKKKVVGAVRWYAEKIPRFEETIRELYKDYLSDITLLRPDKINPKKRVPTSVNLVEERGGDIEFIVCENAGQAIAAVMKRVHEMLPDFLAIWNMDYDIPVMLRELDKAGIAYEDVFCDPSVPPEYRNVWYKQAKAKKETNSKTITQHPADLWHVLFCTAGFYVIDAMCLFKKIRTAKGNQPSYSLDYILGKFLGAGKLKFKEANHLKGLRWHRFMQEHYPAEYVIYNMFDCISIELLDEQTNDMGLTIISLAEISDYSIFPSLPKRLVDILHFFYEEHGMIAGCVGADITTEYDEDIVSMVGWIVTLPAYSVEDNGLFCIEEFPELRTMFRRQTADADILQAYPTGGVIMNISKKTTAIEVCSIDGVSDAARRRAGINLTGGATNAIEICNDVMNMPFVDDVLDAFIDDLEMGKLPDVDARTIGYSQRVIS